MTSKDTFKVTVIIWLYLVQQVQEKLDKEPEVDDVVAASYGYAVTIQHAQGGEWDTVAISLDVEVQYDNARYWSTAVTRAKKQLFII